MTEKHITLQLYMCGDRWPLQATGHIWVIFLFQLPAMNHIWQLCIYTISTIYYLLCTLVSNNMLLQRLCCPGHSLSHYQHCCLCLHCPRIILKTFVPDISMSQLQYLQKEDVDLVLSLLDFRLRFISPNSPLFEERFVFSGGDGLMVTGVMLVIMS